MTRHTIALLLGSMVLLGCGGAASDGYTGPKGSVTGKITFEGQPIPVGSLVLFQAPSAGYTATGAINATGEYSLDFQGTNQVPAVSYVVQVTAPPAVTAPVDPSNMSSPPPAKTSPFPVRYSSTAKSKLEFTVKEGENRADFDLKK